MFSTGVQWIQANSASVLSAPHGRFWPFQSQPKVTSLNCVNVQQSDCVTPISLAAAFLLPCYAPGGDLVPVPVGTTFVLQFRGCFGVCGPVFTSKIMTLGFHQSQCIPCSLLVFWHLSSFNLINSGKPSPYELQGEEELF